MTYKKLAVIGTVVVLASVTGVTMALTNHQPTSHKKAQTIVTAKDSDGNDIMVQSDPVTPVDTTPTTTVASSNVVSADTQSVNTVVPATVSPLSQFQDNVSGSVQGYAGFFVPAYAPDVATFIDNQIRCASRGLTDNTDQSVFDAKLSYFAPQTDANGTVTYRFFTGGCQPVITQR